MAVFGIVAEYNPFHNGHKYQIEKIKKDGDFVVAVMSSNVVQRGDFAIFDKWTRTRAALASGVDLVIELPSFYAMATAEKFAFGAVSTLDALGCIDYLCFGSESADLSLIAKTAELSQDVAVDKRIVELLKDGITYAKARAQAISEAFPECQKIISNPNDILGVEYISALKKLGSKIKPYPILRVGIEHDSEKTDETYASASYLRENLTLENLKEFTPKEAYEIYKTALENGDDSIGISAFSTALLLKLQFATPEELRRLPDVSEGLENRIIKAAKNSKDIESLCEQIKTKRYTLSRIRRILMYALLDFPTYSEITAPRYIRVLGANEGGLALLGKRSASLPVITSLAKAKSLGAEAEKLCSLEEKCATAYDLTYRTLRQKVSDFSSKPILP